MAHAQGINGQTLKEFLEKLTEDGYAAPGRAHTQVTKSAWTEREKGIARKAIAEHYGAPSVRPPPPLPKPSAPASSAKAPPSQWARGMVNQPAATKPTKSTKPTKAELAAAREAKRLEKIAYQREWRAKRAEQLRGAKQVLATLEPTPAIDFKTAAPPAAPPREPTFKAGSIAQLETVPAMLLDRLSARVESLEHMNAPAAALEPVRVLQRVMLDMVEATKTDPSMQPELHRVGRCLARLAVFVTDTVAGPEETGPRRGRPRKAHAAPEETMPAPVATEEEEEEEETVSLPFDDAEEDPASMAAQ